MKYKVGIKINTLNDSRKYVIECPFKGSGEKAYRLYELNLLAFVHKKFKFWPPKCPNYENIEF